MFNNLLKRAKLKLDRDGNPRTAYSLRHTYICMRLMEGADIYQIAKNCRTSVEMIERFYAAHIKSTLDAAAINILKPKRQKKAASPQPPTRPADEPGKPARASRRRKRDVQRLASAPLAGSAKRGSAPVRVPKDTPKA